MMSGVTMPATAASLTSAEDLPLHGEPASLVVGEANAARTIRHAKDAVFLAQVVNDGLLLSIDPA
jgi:hypothetical protein